MSSYTVGQGNGQHTVVRWVNGRAAVVATFRTEAEARARAIALQAA